MTIEEIRAKHDSLSLEQLEAEKHTRDQAIQSTRGEMRELSRMLQPHWLKKQREEMVKGAGKPMTVINTANLGGPFGGK